MARTFIGGRSTRPETDALMQHESVLPDGSMPYETFEQIAGVRYGESRFGVIAAAFAKRLENERRIVVERRDRAFHFLSSEETVDHCLRQITGVRKRINRTARKARDCTHHGDLSEEGAERRDLVMRHAMALAEAAADASRKLPQKRSVGQINA